MDTRGQNTDATSSKDPPQDILCLYYLNPRGKKRKQALLDDLAIKVRDHKLVIWAIGTGGAGWSDIKKGYKDISDTKQKTIENHVFYIEKSKQIMPSYGNAAQFYSDLANLLTSIPSGKERPDLICFCRGGGKSSEISRLNNLALCRSIIECPVPVFASVGHSTDNDALWIKRIADFSTDTPSKFPMVLNEVMEKAGFLPKTEPIESPSKQQEPLVPPNPIQENPAKPVADTGYSVHDPKLRTTVQPSLEVTETSPPKNDPSASTSPNSSFPERFKYASYEKDTTWKDLGNLSASNSSNLKRPVPSDSNEVVARVIFAGFCLAAIVFVVFLFHMSNITSHSSNNPIQATVTNKTKEVGDAKSDFPLSTTSYSPSNTSSIHQPITVAQTNNDFAVPPTGMGMILNTSQIAWCLKEKMRIEAMEEGANFSSSPKRVAYVNNLVDNYNLRCSNFKYAPSDMDRAKSLIEISQLGIRREALKEIEKVDEPKEKTEIASYSPSVQKAPSDIKTTDGLAGSVAIPVKTEPKVDRPVNRVVRATDSATVDVTNQRTISRIQKALSGIYKWIPTKGNELAAMHYAAIHDFQERNGLPVSNKITQGLIQALEDAVSRRQDQGTDKIFLDFDSPKYVMKAQSLLQQVGYDVPYSGYIDYQTETAIRDFQSKNGVKVSGKVGPFLIQQLENKAHTFGEDDPIAMSARKSVKKSKPSPTKPYRYPSVGFYDSVRDN